MSRTKIKKFEHNAQADNVIELGKPLFEIIKGQWNNVVFNNTNPIVIELGCGKGEYSVGLAKIFPEKNFIGIDIKGDRIAVGSQRAAEANLGNVAFLRTDILSIENFFAPDEISEIWITFPDPRIRKRDIKRRLTYVRFLEMYKKILKDKGILHLKTDNEPFFDFSIESLQEHGFKDLIYTKDLYTSDLAPRGYEIKTRFEEIFTEKGFLINYLECKWEK
jgi:tRNA (guanine-N7-)-methyltransferase